MATATPVETLYAFVYWLKRNPVKSVEAGFTHDDLDNMLDAFCTVNTTAGDLVTTANDPLSYGADTDVPGKAIDNSQLADTAGISFTTPSQAICDQSRYPDTHLGGS